MARIRHLAILTEDVDKLVKFYTEGFGLKIVHGVGTATYLTDGHINLAIIPIGPEREIEGPQLRLQPAVRDQVHRREETPAQPRGRIPRPGPGRQPNRPIATWLAALRIQGDYP